jgi:hypothetical protein
MTIPRILNPVRSHLRIGLSAAVTMLLIVVSATSAPPTGPRIREGKDVKVTLDNNNVDGGDPTPSFDAKHFPQNEPSVDISPADPNIIAIGNNDTRLYSLNDPSEITWLGFNISDDDGRTWFNTYVPGFPTDTSAEGLASPLKGLDASGDPIVRFDGEGNLFVAGIAYNYDFDQEDLSYDTVSYVARYDFTAGSPGGTSTPYSAANPPNFTYAFTTIVSQGAGGRGLPGGWGLAGRFEDKPWMAIDTTPSSPCRGTIYYTISSITGGEAIHTYNSRSTDGGATFSNPVQISQGTGGLTHGEGKQSVGSDIAVARDGTVYVTYRTLKDQSVSDAINTAIVHRSDDCGESFGQPVVAATYTRMPRQTPGLDFRTPVWSFIAVDDTDAAVVYVAFMAMPHETGEPANADIFVARSTDWGVSWEEPVRVNDDATFKHQYFPTIDVSNGALHVGWYDFRDSSNPDDPAATNDALNVYYAISNASGIDYPDFSPNVKVTDVSHRTDCHLFLGGIFLGDYIELAAWFDGRNHIAHLAWADNRDIPDEECDPNPVPDPYNFVGRNNTNIYAATLIISP